MQSEAQGGVPDDAIILRRVPSRHIDKTRVSPRAWKWDKNGKLKIESGAFTDSADGDPMSCRLDVPGAEQALLDEVEDVEERSRCAIVELLAGELRKLGLEVYVDSPDDDPSHVAGPGDKAPGRNALRNHCM